MTVKPVAAPKVTPVTAAKKPAAAAGGATVKPVKAKAPVAADAAAGAIPPMPKMEPIPAMHADPSAAPATPKAAAQLGSQLSAAEQRIIDQMVAIRFAQATDA